MAFLKKPLKWTAIGQEPSELKKTEGFKADESPAPGHFDFMFRSTYEAIEELQQKAGEVKTVNNVQPDVNGNVSITLPDTSKLYQKPTNGIPKVDLDPTVQTSLEKADDAAPTTELAKTDQALTTHKADLAHVHWIGTVTGTNTLTATYEPITTLKNGLGVAFLNTTSSTGATTLNINGLGAIPILKVNGNPVTNLKANGIYTLRYANGNFILQGEGGEYGTATAAQVLQGYTLGTENGLVSGAYVPGSVKSVQRGSVYSDGNTKSIDVTISTIDPSKAIIKYYLGSNNTGLVSNFCKPSIVSSTKINFTYDFSYPSSGYIYWEVIEFTNVKSKQSGTTAIQTAGTEQSVTVNSVKISKSFILINIHGTDNATAGAESSYYAYLASSTSLKISSMKTASSTNISWQLIEFE